MTLASAIGFSLILIGLWAMLTRRNIIRIIIGFSIVDTGIHVVMVSVGYIRGHTAPILDSDVVQGSLMRPVVDPVPSALVLTAIVIGVAVTALMLSYAVRMYRARGTLAITEFVESRW